MSHQIILPRVMHIGKGASQRVAETLKGLNCHKPLLVTDKVMVELGYIQCIFSLKSRTNRHPFQGHGQRYSFII